MTEALISGMAACIMVSFFIVHDRRPDIWSGCLQVSPTGGNSGTCNALVPNNSGYNRFLWVIKAMVDNGFMVLIDNHLNLDSTAVDNPTAWVNYWKSLMTGIIGMGQKYQNAVMVDILNEPDSRGLS